MDPLGQAYLADITAVKGEGLEAQGFEVRGFQAFGFPESLEL